MTLKTRYSLSGDTYRGAAAFDVLAGQDAGLQQEKRDCAKDLAVKVQEFVGDLVHQVVHRGIDVRHFLAALRTVAATEWSRAVGALQQINDVRLHAEILPIPWTVESTLGRV